MVVVLVALLAAGCRLKTGEDQRDPPCECPNLERIALSLDWAPGEDVEFVRSRESDGRDLLVVRVRVALDDGDVERFLRLTEAAGLVTGRSATGVSAEGDGFRSHLFVNAGDQASLILAGVPDEQAEETLQPLIDALGLREGAGG